jgi:hypothetical protein
MCKPSKDGKQVRFDFIIPCDPTDMTYCAEGTLCPEPEVQKRSAGIDPSLFLQERDDEEDEFKAQSLQLECGKEHLETFDGEQGLADAATWGEGIQVYKDNVYGSMLGRFGSSTVATKTFTVPDATESITLMLDFLDLNGNGDDGSLRLGIQTASASAMPKVKLGIIAEHEGYTVKAEEKARPGRGAKPGDKITSASVKITDPNKWSQNKLTLAFRVDTDKSIDEVVLGIKNLSITAECKGRRMEADAAKEEEGYYCKAKDYPCGEGDDMVNVCHYSSRLGYQTFCVPEADSEVLRFYGTDYCGPCVGGMGGVNMQ